MALALLVRQLVAVVDRDIFGAGPQLEDRATAPTAAGLAQTPVVAVAVVVVVVVVVGVMKSVVLEGLVPLRVQAVARGTSGVEPTPGRHATAQTLPEVALVAAEEEEEVKKLKIYAVLEGPAQARAMPAAAASFGAVLKQHRAPAIALISTDLAAAVVFLVVLM